MRYTMDQKETALRQMTPPTNAHVCPFFLVSSLPLWYEMKSITCYREVTMLWRKGHRKRKSAKRCEHYFVGCYCLKCPEAIHKGEKINSESCKCTNCLLEMPHNWYFVDKKTEFCGWDSKNGPQFSDVETYRCNWCPSYKQDYTNW